jgi:hypothetical protein
VPERERETAVAHPLKFLSRRDADDPREIRAAVWDEKLEMRKRYRVLILAGAVAALVVPFGFALSLESRPFASPTPDAMITASATVTAPALTRAYEPSPFPVGPVPDGVKLFVIGTVLFGLAAAMRRST